MNVIDIPDSSTLNIGEQDNQPLFGNDQQMPYTTYLSLAPLLSFWEQQLNNEDAAIAAQAKQIMEWVSGQEELRKPIHDISSLMSKHGVLIRRLMHTIFPPTTHSHTMGIVVQPFNNATLYITPRLNTLMQQQAISACLDEEKWSQETNKIIYAAGFILNQLYEQNVPITYGTLLSLTDPNDLQRFYRVHLNADYIDIKLVKPLKELSPENVKELISDVYNVEAWLEHIPPENFEVHGLAIIEVLDVTKAEMLSRLKLNLLQKNALISEKTKDSLQDMLRSYFNCPQLHLGYAALDVPVDESLTHKYYIHHNLLAGEFDNLLEPAFRNSIYLRACESHCITTIEDLQSLENITPLEEALIHKGIRSISIVPLENEQGKIIGILELASEVPFDFTTLNEIELNELIPLFRISLERSRDEVDSSLEAIMREQFTAIHPSVEWRFVHAAYEIMKMKDEGIPVSEGATIEFKNVYPIYGQADIVSSSALRNEAIRLDLLANLQYAEDALRIALQYLKLPIVDQTLQRVVGFSTQLQKGFYSSDEYQIMHFIRHNIGSVFRVIQGKDERVSAAVKKYFSYLSDDLMIVYDYRKNYEESVRKINEVLGNYLEIQQTQMQAVFPHYFEKFRTDGVEYDIYIGQSLVQNGHFHKLYLQNMRLWQLISMCEITRKVESLQPQLPVPITTSQLILAYGTPITIGFRMDEKKFNVDGAYNARYEIIKKRIDKSFIKGTNDRLTVSGKVAIVYFDDADKDEYLEYLQYLIDQAYISEEIEDVELEDLQGVQGLRAFRISVLRTNGEPVSGIDREQLRLAFDNG